MNKKIIILSVLPMLLCSCQKTNELYEADAYNHTDFDLNYYVNWNGIENLTISSVVEKSPQFSIKNANILESDTTYGPDGYGGKYKMGAIDSSFSYGYLSKLYDGRLSCGGYYQRSRVQINKTGYATFFPKQLMQLPTSFEKHLPTFEVALRGGTTLKTPLQSRVNVNYEISFYIRNANDNTYKQIIYKINNVETITDSGGLSDLLTFPLTNEVLNSVAMSMTFSINDDSITSLTDDMSDKEKDHFSIMLYEVMIPDSVWF